MLNRSMKIWQFIITAFFLGVASIPGIIFFQDGGGLLVLQAKDAQSFAQIAIRYLVSTLFF